MVARGREKHNDTVGWTSVRPAISSRESGSVSAVSAPLGDGVMSIRQERKSLAENPLAATDRGVAEYR
jgi:hypothetical protein